MSMFNQLSANIVTFFMVLTGHYRSLDSALDERMWRAFCQAIERHGGHTGAINLIRAYAHQPDLGLCTYSIPLSLWTTVARAMDPTGNSMILEMVWNSLCRLQMARGTITPYILCAPSSDSCQNDALRDAYDDVLGSILANTQRAIEKAITAIESKLFTAFTGLTCSPDGDPPWSYTELVADGFPDTKERDDWESAHI
ncbi:MAG: hypothetical protein V1723_00705 [Candidatus Uhrbacteria bacterium]